MIYLDNDNGRNKLYFRKRAAGDQEWQPARFILKDHPDIRSYQLLKSSRDNLYIIFESQGDIFYTISIDGGDTWQEPFKISGELPGCSQPYATISSDNDIHTVWINSDKVFYRKFNDVSSKWSIIFNLSTEIPNNSKPRIAVKKDRSLVAAWISNTDIYSRVFDHTTKQWQKSENLDLSQSYDDFSIISDKNNQIHIFAANSQGIFHLVNKLSTWQPERMITDFNYLPMANFSASIDHQGTLYLSLVHKNTLRIFQLNNEKWENIKSYFGENGEMIFTPSFSGENSYSDLIQRAIGYDLIFVGKYQREDNIYFVSNANARKPRSPAASGTLKINNAVLDEGRPMINWTAPELQTAYQIVISRTNNTEGESVLYNSGEISSAFGVHQANELQSDVDPLHIFVRIKTADGWSPWSFPYLFYQNKDNQTNGPELEILEIAEESPYIHANSKTNIYYGKSLSTPTPIIIRGSLKDSGSGVQKLTFSPAFGNAPPPIFNFSSPYWAVRYTIKSTDQPEEITITAYDNQNRKTTRVIQVIKDAESPLPPKWVKVKTSPRDSDLNEHERIHNMKKVYVTWQESSDKFSGIRYYLVGNSKNWWQNEPRNTGDSITLKEGDNTVYVFAMDNVGNISEAGTDKIIIDSIEPPPPTLLSMITSVNYFQGYVSADVVSVLVNNSSNGVTLNNQTWKYFHDLKDGEKSVISLTAVDQAGNKSKAFDTIVRLDMTPPEIINVEHNAKNTIMRVKDKLVVEIKGDKNQQGYFELEGISEAIPAGDEGKAEDLQAGDGIYTGSLMIEKYLAQENVRIIGYLKDQAGNISKKYADHIVNFNSNNPIYIDNFENPGDVYPWKNHLIAENIQADGDKLVAKEGTGVLEIIYDLKGEQHWAALSSQKFLPKNLYGNSPYINFWVKGKGYNNSRGFIYFEGDRHYSMAASLKSIPDSYTFSLNTNDQWKLYSLPVRPDDLDNMIKTNRYYIYIFSDDSSDEGKFYLDNLFISYTPIRMPAKRSEKTKPTTTKAKPTGKQSLISSAQSSKWLKKDDVSIADPGSKIPELYQSDDSKFLDYRSLQISFHPSNTFIRNKSYITKVTLPDNINAKNIAGVIKSPSSEIVLKYQPSGVANIYKAAFKIPSDFPRGYYFATVYLETTSGKLLRKKYPVQIIDQEPTLIDLISVSLAEHPLLSNSATRIKLNIPDQIKAESVVVFISEKQKDIKAVKMSRTGAYQNMQQWYGNIEIPEATPAGDYKGIIYIKSTAGKIYKKEFVYSISNSGN